MKNFLVLLLAGAVLASCGQKADELPEEVAAVSPSSAKFEWFEYNGNDPEFAEPLEEGHFFNPVLAGYHPDPSVIRVGEDYYLVNSSFAHWPGLPIYHSKDLVSWKQIGHAIERSEQLSFDGLRISRGIFAPTIRYHDGVYYIITTAVDSGGNFIVTANDPAGPWSKPVYLPEVGGIDPDLFFDDNGRVYIAHNDEPPGEPLYQGHRGIWLWEFDLAAMKVLPDSPKLIVNGGVNLAEKPIWAEGPHIYKIDGWYYLTAAEGGTGPQHSQTIYRTRSLEEDFVPYEHNPILTQRDLDPARPDPIVNAGHADFVQTQHGEWWSVFLASRAYEQGLHNVGRETFLLPIEWRDGWPHILPTDQAIPYRHKCPEGLEADTNAEPLTGNFVWKDDFDRNELQMIWKSLRGPSDQWASIADGALQLEPRSELLTELKVASYVARKQQHENFDARVSLDAAIPVGSSAGLAAFQNSKYHYFLGLRHTDAGHEVFVEQVADGVSKELAVKAMEDAKSIVLGMEGREASCAFFIENVQGEREYLVQGADMKLLSTNVAGGFVGAHIGMYARID